MPAGRAELGAFAEVARLRGNGMTPEEALTAIWDALPGEPPVLDLKQEWPRHEPLDDEEALRQILSIPEGAPWPPLVELLNEGRRHNAAVLADTTRQSWPVASGAIKNCDTLLWG